MSEHWKENRRRRKEAARRKRPCIEPRCQAKVWPEDEKCHYCGAEQPFAANEPEETP